MPVVAANDGVQRAYWATWVRVVGKLFDLLPLYWACWSRDYSEQESLNPPQLMSAVFHTCVYSASASAQLLLFGWNTCP